MHWWNEHVSILKYYSTLSDQNILLVAICGYTNFLELGYLVEVVKYFKRSTFVYNFFHGRCSSCLMLTSAWKLMFSLNVDFAHLCR